ncbi:MAG: hypothetical protein MJA27_11805 [Pseudanabaenales cyanobacterium]|nr:hypothetical protein [Pseudanabaenales cyanobacterium]
MGMRRTQLAKSLHRHVGGTRRRQSSVFVEAAGLCDSTIGASWTKSAVVPML